MLELRVKTRGRYDVEPRAFTARQRQMMMASRAAVSGSGGTLIVLQLENQTPFKAAIAVLPDRSGIDTLYVIVKAHGDAAAEAVARRGAGARRRWPTSTTAIPRRRA